MGGEEPSRHLVGQIVLLRGTASVRIWYFMLIYTQPAACHCSYSFFFLSFFPVLFTCSYTVRIWYLCTTYWYVHTFYSSIFAFLCLSRLPVLVKSGVTSVAGSSHLPTTVRALRFYREKISALSSLVDSRPIAPTVSVSTHAATICRRSQCPFYIYFMCTQIMVDG